MTRLLSSLGTGNRYFRMLDTCIRKKINHHELQNIEREHHCDVTLKTTKLTHTHIYIYKQIHIYRYRNWTLDSTVVVLKYTSRLDAGWKLYFYPWSLVLFLFGKIPENFLIIGINMDLALESFSCTTRLDHQVVPKDGISLHH